MKFNITYEQTVRKFCYTTSAHGFLYMAQKRFRAFWTMILVVAVLVFAIQCKLHMESYLRYTVTTKTTNLPSSISNFPAITFCPPYVFKRSKWSKQANTEYMLANYYANSENEIPKLIKETRKTCASNENITILEKIKELQMLVKKFEKGSFWTDTTEYFVNFQQTVLQCTWNNKIIECNNAFMNRLTDVVTCFTFNPGVETAKLLEQTGVGGGLNLSNYSNKQFKVRGVNDGLQLILNTKQDDYCSHDEAKHGAGFLYQVHSVSGSPSFHLRTSNHLSPGYDTYINIKTTMYDRKTQDLGRCADFVYLYLTPYAKHYVLEHCYMQCVSEYILKTCGCYPPSMTSFRPQFEKRMMELGLNKSVVTYCMGESMRCMKNWMIESLNKYSINSLCPLCQLPCYDKKYYVESSSLLLSKKNLKQILFDNITYEQFRKNYIFVQFTLDNMNIEVVEESQSFKMLDVVFYTGVMISFYLGISFITLFEILHLCGDLIKIYFRRAKTKISVTEVKPRGSTPIEFPSTSGMPQANSENKWIHGDCGYVATTSF